jgi:hypothetical protein
MNDGLVVVGGTFQPDASLEKIVHLIRGSVKQAA